MGWENVPPNTCSIDEPVLPAVELIDQDGRILNVIVASMCDAEWLAHAYAELGMYEGVTSITCRPRPDVPPPGETPPTEFPPIGDAPPQPPPAASEIPEDDSTAPPIDGPVEPEPAEPPVDEETPETP